MMIEKKLGILFLTTCLILITIPTALGTPNIINVNPVSETDAQTAINSAIDSAASGATSNKPGYVLLTAGIYNISAPIILQSNVVLKGAGDDTIIFANGSVCNSDEEHAYIMGSDVSNVEICNLQFQSTAIDSHDGGHGEYRDCVLLTSANNSTVHDILFTRYLYNDGVQVMGGTNITVYNCRIYSAGHDGVAFISGCKNCRICNCDVSVQTNTGCRNDDSSDCEVDHNTFYGNEGGWCCLEVEGECANLNIHHNILHDYSGSNSVGIGKVHASGSVNVHDNIMWNISSYMQIGSGDNNTLGPSDQNVSNWVAQGYGYGSINITSTTIDPAKITVASFTSSATSGSTPFGVTFTDTSTRTPASWSWDFGDGTTSTDQNPTHTYYTAGNYTVTLVVSNEYGTDSKNATITVLEGISHSSGGGGGGGAGGSPEPQSNVETKELSQTFISSGKSIKFDFPQKATSVMNISFDSKKTTGKTTAIVEMLKGKSTLVSGLPADEVCKYLNIWVGNGGFGDSDNIGNAVIGFKVEKSWVQDKNVDKSSINLNRYNDNKWNYLPTSKSGEDDKYLYFTAKTPGFSPFAITGKTVVKEAETETKPKPNTQKLEPKNTSIEAHSEKVSTKAPGFDVVCGIIGLLAVFLHRRK